MTDGMEREKILTGPDLTEAIRASIAQQEHYQFMEMALVYTLLNLPTRRIEVNMEDYNNKIMNEWPENYKLHSHIIGEDGTSYSIFIGPDEECDNPNHTKEN